MKSNRLTRLLAAGAVSAIALTTAFAQESATTTTTTSKEGETTSSATTTTKTIDATGTITTKPGTDFITVKTESSTAPIMYYSAKDTVIVDADGKPVKWAMLKADMPVKYTYVTEGERMVLRKITVQKPGTIEKTTTTTTTTEH